MERADKMQEEWDKRAEINAFHYIDTNRKNWDIQHFFESGAEFVRKEIVPFIERYIERPEYKSVLDLGCGVGRITRALSSRFKHVIGLDVSEKMIEIAKSMHKDSRYKNVVFLKNDGRTFVNIGDNTIDYVFSLVTFQHMPSKEVVNANIREIARVLKEDGVFQIDFPILQGWGYLFGFLPVPRILRRYTPNTLLKLYASVKNPDKLKRTQTFQGAAFTKREGRRMFEDLEVSFQPNSWTQRNMWAIGQKNSLCERAF